MIILNVTDNEPKAFTFI